MAFVMKHFMPDYTRFSEDLKKVERNLVKQHLENINENPERWQAQAWLLERRWWKHFSPNAAVIDFNDRLEKMENEEVKEELEELKDELNVKVNSRKEKKDSK